MWQGCVGHEGCDWVSEKREEQRRERKSVGGVLKRERRVVFLFWVWLTSSNFLN